MTRFGGLFIIVLILISSCKSSKNSRTDIVNLSAKKVIKKHYENGFNKEHLKASLNIKYKGDLGLPNLNASLRLIKDSVIWLSVSKFGIPVAKALITPNEVKYYEKLSRTYFIGNYDLISQWLGVEFDFNQIQNLFIGESLVNLKVEKYKIQIIENFYSLRPKNNPYSFDISFWINPLNFKLEKEVIYDSLKKHNLTINYNGYQEINSELFPEGLTIYASDKKNKTIVDINYRNVTFDTSLKFPFKIPTGYKEMTFDDNK